jgi:hypothetical protein
MGKKLKESGSSKRPVFILDTKGKSKEQLKAEARQMFSAIRSRDSSR